MNYCKIITNGYIVGIGESEDVLPNEIDVVEANTIQQKFLSMPTAPDGFRYRLRSDTLEWELVELPPVEPEPEYEPTIEDKAEAYDILMGVSE